MSIALDVPADVFAAKAIDQGTLLLLRNLPEAAPASLLDLGCGYGALSVPIAARHPQARALLVDRDLLAVRAAAHNARALGLRNATALPSLGYRDLPPGSRFDWVLCNVPARIGPSAIAHFLEAGAGLLTAQGEMRIVVLRDLAPTVESACRERHLEGASRAAEGRRHAVYAIPPHSPARAAPLEDESVYSRDRVLLEALPGQTVTLERPYDASEDPRHAGALAALFSALPRSGPKSILSFRSGYGALPLAARLRFPEARVVAQERDLLDVAFLRRNARALGLGGERLSIAEVLFPAEAVPAWARFDLVLGELSSSAGPGVAALELRQAFEHLAPRGEALVLASDKQEREWLPGALPKGASATVLLRRERASVLRLSRSREAEGA